MEEEKIITTTSKPSMSFKRGKNGIAWELKASGETLDEVIGIIEQADKTLKEKYGENAYPKNIKSGDKKWLKLVSSKI